jgi:hypothetical protein
MGQAIAESVIITNKVRRLNCDQRRRFGKSASVFMPRIIAHRGKRGNMNLGSCSRSGIIRGMVEEPDEKLRAGRRGVFYATLLLALPFLYVASLGPAAVIHNHGGPTTKRVIERVYFPLEFFAVNTGTEKYFSQYVDWWESLAGGP